MKYNLRTLLAGLTALLVWLGWNADRMHRQRAAVMAIRARQGAVEYGQAAGAACLAPWLGREMACHVDAVYLGGTTVADEDLSCLAGLPRLRVLVLTSTAVSDAGLPYLYSQQNLETVDLRFSAVTDAGIDALRRALPKAQILRRSDID